MKMNKKNARVSVKKVEPKFFGFKVVRKKEGKLMSCSVKGLRVQYITDKFVGPRTWGGPLTLFKSLGRALVFKEEAMKHINPDELRVYRCEYIPTIVDIGYRYMEGKMDMRPLSEMPEGTVLARKVKILKKVA